MVFCFIVSGCETDSSVSKNSESNEISTTVLDIKNGIAFLPNENTPFTGKLEIYYSENGDLNYECTAEGTHVMSEGFKIEKRLNENDKIELETRSIGKNNNWFVVWWRKINKSQKCFEENFKDGKRHGLLIDFNENGHKVYQTNYIDGKKKGLERWWCHNKNEKICEEINYKDGKRNGLVTAWRDNGEIKYTVNYIDGKLDKNFHANKSEQKTSDSMQEIISRCRTQMGEYGAAMVKACVDQDIEALQALSSYVEIHKDIVSRCLTQMKEYGYVMVKACVDQDIEAEDALRKY